MAKTRMVNTRFWNDGYISELSPTEKLLFLYLLTNSYTSICGIYELSIRTIAFETGIEEDQVRQIFSRFSLDDKIHHIDGWVVIKNFIKHQKQGSPTVLKGIEAELESVPQSLIGYAYPMGGLSHLNLNSNSNSNLNSNAQSLFDQLWVHYPKKVGKAEALVAFLKLKPDETLTNRIISAVALCKKTSQWMDNDGRYIPHLATFLNKKRYEDEIKELMAPKVVKL